MKHSASDSVAQKLPWLKAGLAISFLDVTPYTFKELNWIKLAKGRLLKRLNNPEKLAAEVETLSQKFTALKMEFSWHGADRLLKRINRGEPGSELAQQIENLDERIIDELSPKVFLYQNKRSLEYYEKPSPFGERVALHFPSVEYDIREASNCLALERFTACVMHSMRVLEAGLDALGRALNVPRGNRGWGSDLNVYSEAWDKDPKKKTLQTKDWRRTFFPAAFVEFRHFANAWRNIAMHSQHAQYNEDEASRVFEHVRAFMQHIATRLKEPKRRRWKN